MQVKIPALLEVSPGVFKDAICCNLADVQAARRVETDASRCASIDALLAMNGNTWKVFPDMLIEDMVTEPEVRRIRVKVGPDILLPYSRVA